MQDKSGKCKETEYVEAHITKLITRKLHVPEEVHKTAETSTAPTEPLDKKPKRKWNSPESK